MKQEFKPLLRECHAGTPVTATSADAEGALYKETYTKSPWREQITNLYAAEWLLYLFYFRPAESS